MDDAVDPRRLWCASRERTDRPAAAPPLGAGLYGTFGIPVARRAVRPLPSRRLPSSCAAGDGQCLQPLGKRRFPQRAPMPRQSGSCGHAATGSAAETSPLPPAFAPPGSCAARTGGSDDMPALVPSTLMRHTRQSGSRVPQGHCEGFGVPAHARHCRLAQDRPGASSRPYRPGSSCCFTGPRTVPVPSESFHR